jgi:mRNA interferase MazF
MADRHCALVLSHLAYNRKSRMAVVCAITGRERGWPFEVILPAGTLPSKAGVGPVPSVIITNAVRQVDYREREMAYVADAPRAVVDEVLDKLLAVLDDE